MLPQLQGQAVVNNGYVYDADNKAKVLKAKKLTTVNLTDDIFGEYGEKTVAVPTVTEVVVNYEVNSDIDTTIQSINNNRDSVSNLILGTVTALNKRLIEVCE